MGCIIIESFTDIYNQLFIGFEEERSAERHQIHIFFAFNLIKVIINDNDV